MNHGPVSNFSPERKLCVYGAGGSGKDTLAILADVLGSAKRVSEVACFMVQDEFWKKGDLLGVRVLPESEFDPNDFEVVVAIGDAVSRKKIVDRLPPETRYGRLIHPSVHISPWAEIGAGCVISAGVVITSDIVIGGHAQLNLNTTICHDARIGDFFTTAPAANVNGSCTFGNLVYLGSNSCIKQGIRICDQVIVGMGAVVVKNIDEPGTYFGNPARISTHK